MDGDLLVEIEMDFKLYKKENKTICFPQNYSLILTSNKPQWELSGPSPNRECKGAIITMFKQPKEEKKKQRAEWDKDIDPRHKNWILVRDSCWSKTKLKRCWKKKPNKLNRNLSGNLTNSTDHLENRVRAGRRDKELDHSIELSENFFLIYEEIMGELWDTMKA